LNLGSRDNTSDKSDESGKCSKIMADRNTQYAQYTQSMIAPKISSATRTDNSEFTVLGGAKNH
jgi:hypothetical protein